MRVREIAVAALLAGLLQALPLGAQEISPVFDMGALAGTASLGAVINQERERANTRQASAPVFRPGGSFGKPAPAGAAALPMRYAATPALRRQVLGEFIERVRRGSPENAAIVEGELRRNDYAAIYDGVVGPYGLAGNDAANVLAAYMILGWMIVHGGQEPPPGAAGGVRAQAAAALSDPRLASPEARARLGEEFKILFVVVHAGWLAAGREGSLDRYADGLAEMFMEHDGLDLRSMKLGPAGFRPG